MNEAVVEVDEDGGWLDTHHDSDVNVEQPAAEDEPSHELKAEETVRVLLSLKISPGAPHHL